MDRGETNNYIMTRFEEHQRKIGIFEGLEAKADGSRAHIEWLKKQLEYNERSLQHTERKIAFWKQEIQKEEEED